MTGLPVGLEEGAVESFLKLIEALSDSQQEAGCQQLCDLREEAHAGQRTTASLTLRR